MGLQGSLGQEAGRGRGAAAGERRPQPCSPGGPAAGWAPEAWGWGGAKPSLTRGQCGKLLRTSCCFTEVVGQGEQTQGQGGASGNLPLTGRLKLRSLHGTGGLKNNPNPGQWVQAGG